jgi:hypothetical protein
LATDGDPRLDEKSQDLPAGRICSKPKYWDEQKKAAVDHYLSDGRCLDATVTARYRNQGASGLLSRHRGYPGNYPLANGVAIRAVQTEHPGAPQIHQLRTATQADLLKHANQ